MLAILNFGSSNEKAKLIAIHYSRQFNNSVVLDILRTPREVRTKDEAGILSRFFWEMLDAAAYDQENATTVAGEINLQYWIERLMNIMGGYLKKSGYEAEWDKACDEA